jgi:hypothetical protein
MQFRQSLCAAALAIMAAAVPLAAHHSFAAEFDGAKRLTLVGKVTKVEWMNPHAFFYLDVKDEKTGTTANWSFELNSPNYLIRSGWTKNSLKLDDVVTVVGSAAKDGSRLVNASTVTTADGKRLFAGSSEPTAPVPAAPAARGR